MSMPVRWSTLKHIGRSPLHYAHALRRPLSPTPAMRLGTLVHQLVLEQPLSVVVYEGERRGRAWAEFKTTHEGKEICTESEMAQAEMISAAVAADVHAMAALRGTREQLARWTIDGRECQGTPDSVRIGHVCELKTTTDASPERFPWQARRMGYLGQLAWYGNGLSLLGNRIESYSIVAVETREPYAVQTYELAPAAIVYGEKQWRACWERLRVCEDAGVWPSYSQSPLQLDVPEADVELEFPDEEAA